MLFTCINVDISNCDVRSVCNNNFSLRDIKNPLNDFWVFQTLQTWKKKIAKHSFWEKFFFFEATEQKDKMCDVVFTAHFLQYFPPQPLPSSHTFFWGSGLFFASSKQLSFFCGGKKVAVQVSKEKFSEYPLPTVRRKKKGRC